MFKEPVDERIKAFKKWELECQRLQQQADLIEASRVKVGTGQSA